MYRAWALQLLIPWQWTAHPDAHAGMIARSYRAAEAVKCHNRG